MQVSKGRTAALICCLMLCVSRRGLTREPDYELDYRAESGCPDEATFARLVQTQLVEFRDAASSAVGSHALVRLRFEGGVVLARLELERRSGGRYEREIRGDSCEEVAPALAFVLAYALGGGHEPEISRQPAPAPSAARSTDAWPSRSSPLPPRRSEAKDDDPGAAAWRVGVGVGLGARTGIGPIWTPVEAGVIDVRRINSQLLLFAARASLLRGEPTTRLDSVGATYFSWLALRLDACPLQLRLFEGLTLLPCLGAHAGRIAAVGQPTQAAGARGRNAQRAWCDIALSARLEQRFLRALHFEAQGDLIAPLTRYRFAFDNPDTSVYRVPGLAVAAFLGIGARFP